LEAHAYDAAGNLGSSGSVQVVVQNNAATRSFAASISPPAASFPDTGSASFTVSTQTLAGAPQRLTIAARFADGAPREIGAMDTAGNVTPLSHLVTIQNSPATRDFLFSSPNGVEMVVLTGVPVQFHVSSSEMIGAPETLHLSASMPAGIAVSIDPSAIQAGQS